MLGVDVGTEGRYPLIRKHLNFFVDSWVQDTVYRIRVTGSFSKYPTSGDFATARLDRVHITKRRNSHEMSLVIEEELRHSQERVLVRR